MSSGRRPVKELAPREIDREFVKAITFPMHVDDYELFKKIVHDDGLTIKGVLQALVEGYMRGDKDTLKSLQHTQLLRRIPKEKLDRFTLSQRDRQAVIDELSRELDGEEKGIG